MSETLSIIRFIIQTAVSLGAEESEAPSVWTGDRFNAELLASIQRGSSPNRVENDLPKEVIATKLDGVPVLLGQLENPADRPRVQDALRRYRNQAIIARSWLGAEALNLQCFLVGPRGSVSTAKWRQLAAEAEADDRVCRKLVWLPPEHPTTDDARSFLSRTFLARPWEHGLPNSSANLDRMGTIDLPSHWAEAIDDDTLDAEALVAKLIEIDGQDIS